MLCMKKRHEAQMHRMWSAHEKRVTDRCMASSYAMLLVHDVPQYWCVASLPLGRHALDIARSHRAHGVLSN